MGGVVAGEGGGIKEINNGREWCVGKILVRGLMHSAFGGGGIRIIQI